MDFYSINTTVLPDPWLVESVDAETQPWDFSNLRFWYLHGDPGTVLVMGPLYKIVNYFSLSLILMLSSIKIALIPFSALNN